MELSTDNYITIVTTLLTLVFGGGLGKSVLDRRAERRKAEEEAKRAEAEKRELYRQGFLENLQFTLNLNRRPTMERFADGRQECGPTMEGRSSYTLAC